MALSDINSIIEWIQSDIPLTKEMFDEYKHLTRKISSSEQILFLKKVVNEIHKENVKLHINDLIQIKSYSLEAFQEFGEPKEIDYSLDLVLHTLNLIHNRKTFPENVKEVYGLVKDITDFICDYLQNNIDYLTKINLLFDKCPERTAIKSKSPDEYYVKLRGNNYKIYNIYQGYSIKNKKKHGSGELIRHFKKGIYAKKSTCMLEIVECNPRQHEDDYIKYGNNIIFDNKKYPFEWKKDKNNYLITPEISPVASCEGRKSEIACNLSNLPFWWCYGRKCFKANQIDHDNNDWKSYSLRDFLKILNLPFDEVGYYIFISEINRLNRLLDRIKCKECAKILRPSKQTNFGFYRVSHFHCNNSECSQFHKEIYLTHCLNSKCANVIDDRVAKKCPNGFIICDVCGSCCSNEQFARRIDTLKTNGQSVPQSLIDMYSKREGHWEKTECYCYKCQKEMVEDKNGDFVCKECNIK